MCSYNEQDPTAALDARRGGPHPWFVLHRTAKLPIETMAPDHTGAIFFLRPAKPFGRG